MQQRISFSVDADAVVIRRERCGLLRRHQPAGASTSQATTETRSSPVVPSADYPVMGVYDDRADLPAAAVCSK
jgi:hypothetical protein